MSDTKLLASGVTKAGTYPAVSFAAGTYVSVTAAMQTTGEYAYAAFDVLDAAGNVVASGEASGNAPPTLIENVRSASTQFSLRVNDIRGGSLNVSCAVSSSPLEGSQYKEAINGGQGQSIQVGASRTLTLEDDGKVIEMTATATLTVPANLPIGFAVAILPSGTISIAFSGTTGNGSSTTITRTAASNAIFAIQQRPSSRNAYVLTGV